MDTLRDLLSLSLESFQPKFLANDVSMKASLQSAVRLISPNQSFAQHLFHHLEEAGSLVPSKSTMYRHRLTLTLSWYLRLQRQLASEDCSCTSFMVDSSPQGGVDLLQHICMVLSERELLRAWELAQDLFNKPKASEAEEWMKSLSDILMWQRGPAVGIGSGKGRAISQVACTIACQAHGLRIMGISSGKFPSMRCLHGRHGH